MEYRKVNGQLVKMNVKYDNREEYEEYKQLTPQAKDDYNEAIKKGMNHKEAIEYAASKAEKGG